MSALWLVLAVKLHTPVLWLQAGSAGGSRKVFVIDEIGKMELFSQSFIRAVRQTLDGSSCTILGTIPVPKGKPLGLVEEVRGRSDVKVFTVSTNNSYSVSLGRIRNCYALRFCLHPECWEGRGTKPLLSLSCSWIKCSSCVTDSTTKGCFKCQNNLQQKTQLWTWTSRCLVK